jgi:hypothetical protein
MKRILIVSVVAVLALISCNQAVKKLDFLKDLNGKYPNEVALFDNAEFSQRLEKLLGDKYSFLKETCAVETPIVADSSLFVASGCQAHNCDATNFIVVYSFADDALYAGIREEGQVSVFSEKEGSTVKAIDEWSQPVKKLDFLQDLNGQSPNDAALFDQTEFTLRLEKLLADKYSFLRETWAVETPIEVADGVFAASGCQAHNCDATNFIVVYSFADDVLYAGVRVEGEVSVFSEKEGSTIKAIDDWAQPVKTGN